MRKPIGPAKVQPLKIRHVKIVRPKRGGVYCYFKTGQHDAKGREILTKMPAPDAPDFWSVYASLCAGRSKRANVAAQLTLTRFIRLYEKSRQFQDLSPNSQNVYSLYLRQLDNNFNGAPADDIKPQDMRLLVDDMADKPGAAAMILAATASLYAWGRERGHVTARPCDNIKPPQGGEHKPWPQELLDAALASDKPVVSLATHLLYYTGQRIGDVCALRWTDIRSGRVELEQEKTGKPLSFPVHPKLAEFLATVPRSGLTILAKDARPYDRQQIRWHLQRFAKALGYKIVPHGLRKNAVNSLLEAGCSVAETASVTGQSLTIVEYYAKARNNRALSDAALLKWGRNG